MKPCMPVDPVNNGTVIQLNPPRISVNPGDVAQVGLLPGYSCIVATLQSIYNDSAVHVFCQEKNPPSIAQKYNQTCSWMVQSDYFTNRSVTQERVCKSPLFLWLSYGQEFVGHFIEGWANVTITYRNNCTLK